MVQSGGDDNGHQNPQSAPTSSRGTRATSTSSGKDEGSVTPKYPCGKCQSGCKSGCLQCSQCSTWFHQSCASVPNAVLGYLEKVPGLTWRCNKCLQSPGETVSSYSESIDNIKTVDGKISNLSGRFDFFVDSFANFKSELMNSVNKTIDEKIASIPAVSNSTNVSPANITWASRVQPSSATERSMTSYTTTKSSQAPSKTSELLVLSPANNGRKTEPINEVRKSVLTKLKNVQYEFVKADKDSGKISLGFRNKDVREEVDELLNKDEHLATLGYMSKSTDKLLPKIMISGVENSILDELYDEDENLIDTTDLSTENIRELQKRRIINLVLAKNPTIADLVQEKHTFDVVFVTANKSGRQNLTIGFKVSPAIRAAIFSSERHSLYLECGSYEVRDRFHVKQCYHCQLFGHTSNQCPQKNGKSVCLYCMGDHTSKTCSNKKDTQSHRCTNCAHSKDPRDRAEHKTHNSTSPNCPVLIKEHQRIAKITDFNSKNVR